MSDDPSSSFSKMKKSLETEDEAKSKIDFDNSVETKGADSTPKTNLQASHETEGNVVTDSTEVFAMSSIAERLKEIENGVDKKQRESEQPEVKSVEHDVPGSSQAMNLASDISNCRESENQKAEDDIDADYSDDEEFDKTEGDDSSRNDVTLGVGDDSFISAVDNSGYENDLMNDSIAEVTTTLSKLELSGSSVDRFCENLLGSDVYIKKNNKIHCMKCDPDSKLKTVSTCAEVKLSSDDPEWEKNEVYVVKVLKEMQVKKENLENIQNNTLEGCLYYCWRAASKTSKKHSVDHYKDFYHSNVETEHTELKEKFPAFKDLYLSDIIDREKVFEEVGKYEEEFERKNIMSTNKTSFCYILADNTPFDDGQFDGQVTLKQFVESIFYIGRGTKERCFAHFSSTEVDREYNKWKNQQSKKMKDNKKNKHHTFFRLWKNNKSVRVQYIAYETNQLESELIEICTILAIGCENLTNERGGTNVNMDKLTLKASLNSEIFGMAVLQRAYNERDDETKFFIKDSAELKKADKRCEQKLIMQHLEELLSNTETRKGFENLKSIHEKMTYLREKILTKWALNDIWNIPKLKTISKIPSWLIRMSVANQRMYELVRKAFSTCRNHDLLRNYVLPMLNRNQDELELRLEEFFEMPVEDQNANKLINILKRETINSP